MEKEFNLSNEDAAELLHDLADSIEKGSIALDGDGWKVYHETDEKIPLRIFSDDQGTEIGFKILRKKRNQA
ncbi:MAG: amphi-Trp domain-containing protein [Candidatus Nanohaloarchaea archaeon]